MTLLSYKVGDIVTSSYQEALKLSKEKDMPIKKMFKYHKDCNLNIKNKGSEENVPQREV